MIRNIIRKEFEYKYALDLYLPSAKYISADDFVKSLKAVVKMLDVYGKEGWELVAMDGDVGILKREI